MNLFDVYPLLNITPVKAEKCNVWDDKGNQYLDLYGGHAVISIGHSHPHYIRMITEQLAKIGFYSNSVQNPLQVKLAEKLGKISGCDDYQLFLCNSGAEANENAIKLASFVTGRKKFIAFSKGFHGRTSAAVSLTDNPKIIAPVNQSANAIILPFNNLDKVRDELLKGDVAAVIIEGIQGIGGINIPDELFITQLANLANESGAMLIVDEIQSGYGRSGRFFAHQYARVQPDIITTAKGMGNGFPVGGVLIRSGIKPWSGMLGTTFGGNHLACAAAIAVIDVMENENLVENAFQVGNFLMDKLQNLNMDILVRGKGLMIGIEFQNPVAPVRKKLLEDHFIFTGFSGEKIIRLLPPLCLGMDEAEYFLSCFEKTIKKVYPLI
jgi:acetylornithine/N-succinyldiaminopimelate aminotransferase